MAKSVRIACLFAAAALLLAADAQKITSITPTSGGVKGGTRVTILGESFDSRGRSNDVYIGSDTEGVFCDPVPNECHDKRIVCITPEFDGRGSFPLRVVSFGTVATCGLSSGCTFSYMYDYTPVVTGVRPEFFTEPGALTVTGSNFARGDETFASFDFTAHLGDEERCDLGANPVSSTGFVCEVENGVFPGINPLNLQLGTRGNAIGSVGVMVIPSVTGISASQGSTEGGQRLTVTGNFFSRVLTENVVTIHGTECTPVSVTQTQLVCITGKHAPTATKAVTYTAGAKMDYWGLGAMKGQTVMTVQQTLRYLSPDISQTAAGFGGVLGSAEYCLSRNTALFAPDVTGNYTFAIAGDDQAELWLGTDENPVPYVKDVAPDDINFNTHRIAYTTSYTNSFLAYPEQTSEPKWLVAGQKYWMRTFTANGLGGHSGSVRVQKPNGEFVVNPTNVYQANTWESPVAVISRGIRSVAASSCSAFGSCNFNYVSPSATVTGVTASAAAGSAITITGTNFPTAATLVTVTTGHHACAVTSASATQIVCTTDATAAAGTVPVVVTVVGTGNAVGEAKTTIAFSITSADNTKGYVTIMGNGLAVSTDRVTVTVGGSSCTNVKIAGNTITCAPATSVSSGTVTATVTINDAATTVASRAFTFQQTLVRPGTTTATPMPALMTKSIRTGATNTIELVVYTWAINNAADVSVTFGDDVCRVITAVGSSIVCEAPAIKDVQSYNVTATFGGETLTIGSVSVIESVTSVAQSRISKTGGNVVEIYYGALRVPTSVIIAYRGVPCKSTYISGGSFARCFLDDASLTNTVVLPTLLSASSTTPNVGALLSMSPGVSVVTGGFKIPKGSYLFTRRTFDHAITVSAKVTALTSGSDCAIMSGLSPDASSRYGGFTAYSNGNAANAFHIANSGYAPVNSQYAEDASAPAAGTTQTWVLEIHSGGARFFVDGTLMRVMNRGWVGTGHVGFPVQCQDIRVEDLKVEDLRPATLTMTVDGRTVAMLDEPVLVDTIKMDVRTASTVVAPGGTLTLTLGTEGLTSFNVYAFPEGTTDFQLSPDVAQLCSNVGYTGNLAGTLYTATCTVGDVAGGKFILRIVTNDGGFATAQFPVTILPTIQSVTSTGSYNGGILQVVGSGFSNVASETTITINGVNCPVVRSTTSFAACEYPAATGAALGPFTVAVSFKATPLTCSNCKFTYMSAANSPAVTSVEASAALDRSDRSAYVITGTGLSAGTAIVSGKVCESWWNTATKSYCAFDNIAPAPGSYSFKYLTASGYASIPSGVQFTIARATGFASPATTAAAGGTDITVNAGTITPSKGMTSVASFDFSTGNLENSKWTVSEGKASSYTCGSAFSEFGGFESFNGTTVITRAITGLGAHTYISVALRVSVHSGATDDFVVEIDGTQHRLNANTLQCRDQYYLSSACSKTTRTDCLIDTVIAVPHTGATVTIKLSLDAYYSATDRSWGLVSYDVLTGALAYTATVGGANCPIVKATPHAVVCTAPSGTGVAVVAIADGATALPCADVTQCQVTYAAANNLAIKAVAYTTLPAASSGKRLDWGFLNAATATNGALSSITRASGSGWSGAAASLQRFRKEDMFVGVKFSFSGSLMFGISSEERLDTSYGDINFAFYVNGNSIALYRRGVGLGNIIGTTTESTGYIRVLENDAVVFEVAGQSVQVGRITSWPIRLSAALNSAGSKLWDIEPLFRAGAPAASTQTSVAILGENLPDGAIVTLDGSACDRVSSGRDIVVCDLITSATAAGSSHIVSLTSANGAATATKALKSVVTGLSSSTGSSTGNHVITILGGGFTGSIVATIGASACSIVSFSFSEIVCIVPAGSGSQIVAVTVAGTPTECASFNRADSNTAAITYVCPSYTYTAPATTTSAVSVSAGVVTLTGTGFPTTVSASDVMLLGTTRCPITSVSATQVTCDATKIAAATYNVIASFTTGGAGASQSLVLPVVATATPNVVGQAGNARITITGSGFGETGTLTVTFSGSNACASITDRTATSFVCTTTALAFSSLTVTSPAGGSGVVAAVADNTHASTISTVSPTTVSSGQAIVLSGSNFAAGSTVSVGAASCSILTESATSITCRVESGAARGAINVQITAGPRGASNTVSVTGALAVLGTSPRTAAPGATVTVVGSAFVNTETYLVRLGNYECKPVVFVNAGSLTCTAPDMSDFVGATLDVSVAVVAASTTQSSTTYIHAAVVSPTVTGVSPTSGTRAGGDTLVITGTNFENDPQKNRVSVGGAECAVQSASTTQLTCILEPILTGVDGARTVSVTSRGIPATSTGSFTATMTITGISPSAPVSVEGGVVLTLTGTGFAESMKDSHMLTVGGIKCAIESMTTTSVTCKLGASPRPYVTDPELSASYTMHPETDGVIRLTINGTTADIDDSTLKIQYRIANTPTITNVAAPSTVMSGSTITITGTGFAASGNVVELTPAALSNNISLCTVTVESATSITCTADLTTFGSHFVRVNVPGSGLTYTASTCASGFLTCDGICLANSDCSYSYWGIFNDCDALFKVMRHDTYCDSNSGSDRVNLPMVLDGGKSINWNCPLYSCEGKDCNTTLSIGGKAAVVSTCGKDPNGKLITAKAHVASVTGSSTSGSKGGNRITLTGTNLPIESVIRFYSGDTAVSACTPIVSTGNTLVCEMTAQSADVSGLTMKVTVSGVEAVCDACTGFAYSAALTPSVTAYSPTANNLATIVANVPLTITGTRFSNDNTDNYVYIGGSRCVATASTTTQIVCTGPDMTVGQYGITVRVEGKGLASDTTSIRGAVRPTITGVSGAVSSLNGGARITATGSALTNAVRFYISNCADFTPISSTSTQIVFNTPQCSTGSKQVRAQVVAGQDSVCASCAIVYSSASTPTATITGTSSITVTIPNAPTNAADIAVTIGVGVCTMTGVYSAGIYNCDLPASHPAGTYTVVVTIAGLGKATIASPLTKTYAGGITSIAPATGSLGGSQTLTISGTGLPTNTNQVSNLTVAGVPCAIATATGTSMTCVTAKPMGAITGVAVLTIGETMLNGGSFSFEAASTPIVTSVSPNRGSTAGGTRLVITGERLSSTVQIKIDGVVCTQAADQIAASTPTAYQCTTGNHGTSMVSSDVVAHDSTFGKSVTVGKYQYIDLWSRWTTWGNNAPPAAGDSVVISEGQTIMLDISPPQLNLILVMGHLIFDSSVDLTLESTYIMINFGRMTVGTPDAPYTKNAVIRMHGTRLTPEIPVHGAKVLALRNGAIDMHGIVRNPTWTKVAATAPANSRTIQVRGPVDWKTGDVIVITSTNYEMEQAEKRTVVSVTNGASSVVTLEINEPLQHYHNGAKECFDGKVCIEEIAEVMLLTRNIVFEGDSRTQELGFGATMFLMPMGQDENAYARISYVEYRDVGQQYIVGRYPVHFHVTGSVNNSYVNGTSVHRSLNRAFSIHGVSNNTYVNNVAYDIQGHAFFIEDGSEKYNVIKNNLVAVVHTSTSNLNTDVTPACFWCVSTLNKLDGNHAAGSSAYGFWISPFHPHSTGPTYSPSICPSSHKMWHFENNVAHSNKKYGLNIFQFWWPKKTECDFNGPDEQATIRNHFSFKNKIHGVSVAHSEVGQVGAVMFDNLVSSSNGQHHEDASAFWIERLNAPNMTIGVKNSFLIALTSNKPEVTPNTRRGINLPLNDNFFSDNVTFVNYVDNNFGYEPQRWAERLSFCFPWGWEATSRKLSWINSPNRIRFRFDHHGLLNDEDGTLSGSANTQTLAKTSLMDPAYCVDTNIASPKKAIVCNADHKMRRHGVDTISNIWEDQIFEIEGRKELVPEIKHKYSMIIPMNRELTIDFNHAENPDTWAWTLSPRFSKPTEKLLINTLYKETRYSVNATFDGKITNMLAARPTLMDTTPGYFFGDRVLTSVVMQPVMSVGSVAVNCPAGGCPIEPPSPAAPDVSIVPDTTQAPVIPASTQLTSSTTTNGTPTSPQNFNTTLAPTTASTIPPQGASTPLISTTGAVTLAGSFAGLDSASTVQLTAIFSWMACRSEGGDADFTRLVLNPLRLTDAPSADLLGSFLMLAGVCGLYLGIAQLVFHCILRCTTSTPQRQDEEAEQVVDVDQVIAERIFRAKLYLMYPRVPVVVATLLLPGVVLESCSLLYGDLMGAAAGWEKFAAVAGLVASLAFISYQHVVGVFAKLRVLPRYEADGTNSNEDDELDEDSLADLASLNSSGEKDSRSKDYAVQPDTFDSTIIIDGWSACRRVSIGSPSSRRLSNYSEANQESLGGPTTLSVGGAVHNLELIEFPSILREGCGPFDTSPTLAALNNSWRHMGSASATNFGVLMHDSPSKGPNNKVFLQPSPFPQDGLPSGDNFHVGPNSQLCDNDSSDASSASGLRLNTNDNDGRSQWSASTDHADGQNICELTDDVVSPSMQCAVPHYQPSFDGRQHSPPTGPTPAVHDEPSSNPEADPWFVWYSVEERGQQRWIVRQTLMAMGHWSPYVARSVYCVVTPSRPEVVPWMGPHNSWRLFLVSAVAAVSPSNRDHCMYVQAVVAAICFVHGLLIYATRVFRIPALNPLQGTQSILLGLLACAPFIADADALAAFSNALMALSLLTVVLSALAILLEWRVRRTQAPSQSS